MAMTESSDLRIRVAEAMGWGNMRIGLKGLKGNLRWLKQQYRRSVPAYSTSMDAAKELIDVLAGEGWSFYLERHTRDRRKFTACFTNPEMALANHGYDADPATAICKAFLKVKGKP